MKMFYTVTGFVLEASNLRIYNIKLCERLNEY